MQEYLLINHVVNELRCLSDALLVFARIRIETVEIVPGRHRHSHVQSHRAGGTEYFLLELFSLLTHLY